MMISQTYTGTVYVADYTRYCEDKQVIAPPCKGVLVSEELPPLISSFVLDNKNGISIEGVNIEHNPSLLKRADGTLMRQCEGFFYAHRDESPAWILFFELKYCDENGVYENTLTGMNQLKKTCRYILEEKALLDNAKYKRYFVVSTPNVEPLDPFDANYFDQDDMLSFKEECHAILFLSNRVVVHTPVHLKLK